MKRRIYCIGEVLWDSMPMGLFLGGAPYNVAYHLKKFGEDVFLISRVGNDNLGYEAVKRVAVAGVSTELIQFDNQVQTGFVEVVLGANGIPVYNIKKPVAWDEIELKQDVIEHIKSADAIIFGTLAQRSKTSKKTIQWIDSANCLKVLDLNLRFPHVDRQVINHSLNIADILKLNHEELRYLQSWFNLSSDLKESIEAIVKRFTHKLVCVTRGDEGAILWNEGQFFEDKGYNVHVVDTVGSGDAFLAVIVSGYLAKLPPEKLVKYSNQLGAYIATQYGSTPDYSIQTMDDIKSLPLFESDAKLGKTFMQ